MLDSWRRAMPKGWLSGVIVAIALTASAMMVDPAAPASAQEYPISDGDVTLSDSSTEPGSSITVSGEGFAPGTEVTITVESDPIELARVDADASGWFTARVTLPENIAPGTHTIRATGKAAGGGALVLASEIAIEGNLPFTGSAVIIGLIVAGSLALLAAGAVAVRLVRG